MNEAFIGILESVNQALHLGEVGGVANTFFAVFWSDKFVKPPCGMHLDCEWVVRYRLLKKRIEKVQELQAKRRLTWVIADELFQL